MRRGWSGGRGLVRGGAGLAMVMAVLPPFGCAGDRGTSASPAGTPTPNVNDVGELPTATLSIGDDVFTVEVARSQQEIATGLMYRTLASLPAGQGMFFRLPFEYEAGFYNPNVPFDIDVAYIRADRTIARIVQLRANDPTIVRAGEPVRYVLETRAGELSARGISAGDVVVFGPELSALVD